MTWLWCWLKLPIVNACGHFLLERTSLYPSMTLTGGTTVCQSISGGHLADYLEDCVHVFIHVGSAHPMGVATSGGSGRGNNLCQAWVKVHYEQVYTYGSQGLSSPFWTTVRAFTLRLRDNVICPALINVVPQQIFDVPFLEHHDHCAARCPDRTKSVKRCTRSTTYRTHRLHQQLCWFL